MFLIKLQAEKFLRNHLWSSLVFNKVAGWRISENLQEIPVTESVSFLIKLQAEKICKNSKKTPGITSFLMKLHA